MKKIFTLILLSLLVVTPMIAIAANVEPVPNTSINTVSDIIDLLNKLVNYLYTFLLIAAGAYLIWGGIDFVFSAGDETKVKASRSKITYALIGVAVAVVSKGLMNIVIGLVD